MSSYSRGEWAIDEVARLSEQLGTIARETSDNQAAADVSYIAGRLRAVYEMLLTVLMPVSSGGFEKGENYEEKELVDYLLRSTGDDLSRMFRQRS